MKIYDAHVHTGIDYFLYTIKGEKTFNLPLKSLLKRMRQNGVGKSIVMWCPSIKEISCCVPTDLVRRGTKIASVCPVCKKTVAVLDHDPYRRYNLRIVEEIKKNKAENKLIPFFMIHMQNPFIKDEINFYIKKYKKFGLKFHTFVSKRSMTQISKQMKSFKFPILVHSGPEKYTHPRNILEFAKHYRGKVLMAHAARLSVRYLKEANRLDNVFVDVTPLTSFYKRILTSDYSTILEKKDVFSEIKAPEDIYYFLLRYVDYRKLLFGTDAPWCNKFGLGYEEEVRILRDLKLEKVKKEAIAFRNFERFVAF
jgi:predicted TIM-barrel fold metal-dependent hydrolase